ncbi:MAG: M1 family metallopeptidase [Burkholderiales bacterium]
MTALARATSALVALALFLPAAAADLVLDVNLEPSSRRFEAIAELRATGDLAFQLNEGLAVRRATANGREVKAARLPFGAGSGVWRIPAAKGAKLRIEYGGTLPILDRSLSHRGVLGSMPPMAATEGSFLPAGSGWYPHPRGLFTYAVTVSVPAPQRALVAGRLIEERESDGRYVARFEFGHPTDGVDLMAGPYVVREKMVPRNGREPLRLRTYFYGDLDALAGAYLEDSARYVALYSNQIGEYPYSGFSVVASPLPTGFGMPTLTYLGAQVLKLPFIRATSLGHEVLHNWWGNGVHVDYATGNWSEGLTTFMADYHYKERESARAAMEMRLGWLRDLAAIPEGAHEPLSAFRSRTHGAQAAVGYGKSAMLFFMLRDALGEDAFARGLQRFWMKHRFTVASWRHLQAAFEEASGRPLAGFFRQWLERAGGPEIAIREARASGRNGKTMLSVTLEQRATAYTLDVPVELASKTRREVRSVRTHRERMTETIELDWSPDIVRLDPEFRVWRLLGRSELPPILREWIIAPAPVIMVASADDGFRSAAQTLAQAFFERKSREVPVAQATGLSGPVLLVGPHAAIDETLAALRLPPRPSALAGQGSTQVWTVEDPASAMRLAVVSARDADSLRAIVRPLPHYGSQSYLSFGGTKALTRGVWPANVPAVPVKKEP